MIESQKVFESVLNSQPHISEHHTELEKTQNVQTQIIKSINSHNSHRNIRKMTDEFSLEIDKNPGIADQKLNFIQPFRITTSMTRYRNPRPERNAFT